ncbi:MAG: hypothetical protein ACE5G5_04365 [Candidatus Methylomirabilales bacterium]
MPTDYGREEYVTLLASRDPGIRDLVAQGYEFVTNAFRPGAAPRGVRTRDAEAIKARHRKEGYRVEVTSAYDETGDLLPSMVAVWRKRRAR